MMTMMTNYHKQISEHNYQMRQQRQLLKRYRKVTFTGVPVYKGNKNVVTFVSVYLNSGEELDHINIKLSNKQYQQIHCFKPYTAIGLTTRYYSPITKVVNNQSYVFSMPSYTIKDLKQLCTTNTLPHQKLSQWQKFHAQILNIDENIILTMPNDGSREKYIERYKHWYHHEIQEHEGR